MDQTGVLLVPADLHTYEARGAKEVAVIGADDKRQITACVASSLAGDMLPLQLIFQGKTEQCHPPSTAAARAAHVHITHSDNHWSNQQTMQQWITEVLLPYADRVSLPKSDIVLVLDVWAVHKSEEFRTFLREQHPRIHLVFVPANCTSKLQVADVALQRSFKHGLRRRFNHWAADIIKEQIANSNLIGLNPFLKMASIKPLILQWSISSWERLQEGKEHIIAGWHTCCSSLYDVHDQEKRSAVVEAVVRGEFVGSFVPGAAETEEDTSNSESDQGEDDDDTDELDVMKARVFGERKSTRKRSQRSVCSYMLDTSQIALSEDSDS